MALAEPEALNPLVAVMLTPVPSRPSKVAMPPVASLYADRISLSRSKLSGLIFCVLTLTSAATGTKVSPEGIWTWTLSEPLPNICISAFALWPSKSRRALPNPMSVGSSRGEIALTSCFPSGTSENAKRPDRSVEVSRDSMITLVLLAGSRTPVSPYL